MCANKPLVMWTVDAALDSGLDCVAVSTDDLDIIELCYGITEVRVRPPMLCTDAATSRDVIVDALAHFPGYDRVMLLQPTSPMRTANDIERCLRGYDTVVSVTDDATRAYNGAIYLMRADRLMHYDAEYPMPPWRSIDIDTSADLYEACKRLSEVC